MPGRIVKEDIEKVREAADLYDVVSASVTLQHAGSNAWKGLCPFHDEKTPSFNVNVATNHWKCFGCGLGGDVFEFVQRSEGIEFPEAVQYLADRYRIELHYDQSAHMADQTRRGTTRSRLLEANAAAQKFFMSQLMTKEALPARQLLGGRTFTQADCERFGCGYAPRGWDELTRHLASKGFTNQEMIDAGLARANQRGGVYDYFRGRATWPIRDTTGQVIGFGARKLYDDDTNPGKYINTADTALYHKNRVLYGIDLAKTSIAQKRQVVVVEGYTDVMACHLAGVTNAVATCGTAFGEEHAKIIRRLISDNSLNNYKFVGPTQGSGVVFTFDGDAAGQKAALRAFQLDTAFLTQTFVAIARENLDPCDLRIQYGDEAVRELIAGKQHLVEWIVRTSIARFDTQYVAGRVGAMKAVAPIIAQIRDISLLEGYAQDAAREIGVDIREMREEVYHARRSAGVRNEDAFAPNRQYASSGSGSSVLNAPDFTGPLDRVSLERFNAERVNYYEMHADDSVFTAEQQMLCVLVQIPWALDAAAFAQMTEATFTIPVFRDLYRAVLVAGGLPDAGTSPAQWVDRLAQAGGPLVAPALDALAVMQLPIPVEDDSVSSARASQGAAMGGAPVPSAAQREFAAQVASRLLDGDMMRGIAALRVQMNKTTDGTQKLALLQQITALEKRRADAGAGQMR
ncbi:DNA primase [Alloscardovia macacae]|uniref:DNA primase n=1 Tax=Alloscardovia macacae TaxID=1160091 RepID=A0A261F3T0_9BIFI|nr:DNA primase [Alloscardovia macacae]OZG53748.1 DNA primase [Alloscardovia macacae]